MGFDLYGQAPKSATGRYFRNNGLWWRPLHALICLTCAEILTEQELRGLGFNEGFAFSAEKAAAIASRLSEIATDENQLAGYERKALALLPESYQEGWSKDNILEFVEFLRDSGGFEVF